MTLSEGGLRRRGRGFTLIEMLAAMVIFSTGAVVLFSWIGQTAQRLSKLSIEQDQLFAELSALSFARSLNPMQQGSGRVELDGSVITWTSQPQGEPSPVRGAGGGQGLYTVQIFETRFVIDPPRGARSQQTLLLAGWRQVAQARSGMPFAIDGNK